MVTRTLHGSLHPGAQGSASLMGRKDPEKCKQRVWGGPGSERTESAQTPRSGRGELRDGALWEGSHWETGLLLRQTPYKFRGDTTPQELETQPQEVCREDTRKLGN